MIFTKSFKLIVTQCLTLEQELGRVRQQLTEHVQQLELQRDQEQRAEVGAEENKRNKAQLQNVSVVCIQGWPGLPCPVLNSL